MPIHTGDKPKKRICPQIVDPQSQKKCGLPVKPKTGDPSLNVCDAGHESHNLDHYTSK